MNIKSYSLLDGRKIYRVGHLEVETPWGNAGGVVKTPEDAELMAHTGVGWVEAGSYTLEPREGNESNGKEAYYHNPETGETFNSLGMPNKGIDKVERDISDMKKTLQLLGKKLVVNVAPVSEDPVEESRELVQRAYEAGADAVLLNVGCPNVVKRSGERHEMLCHNPRIFGNVILELAQVIEKTRKPIFIRTSPFLTYENARTSIRAVNMGDLISAIFVPNSWPVENGGKSGPAMADEAYKQTSWAITASKISGRNIDVVSSAGIMNGKELKRRMHLGAVAGAGTTLYYESAEEGWSEATDRLLRQFAESP